MLQYFLRIHHQHRESFWSIVQEKLSSEIQLFRRFASQLCMLEDFRLSHSGYAIGFPMRERRLQVVLFFTVTSASASWQSNCSFICAIGFPMLEDAWAEICWANSSLHSATAQQILSWVTELIVRKNSSAFHKSPLKCSDKRPPFLLKNPRSNALVALKTGCPLSSRLRIIISAVRFHWPSGLWVCVPYHFCSVPGRGETTNVLSEICFAESLTFRELEKHFIWKLSSLFWPIDVVVHRREENPIFEFSSFDAACCVILIWISWSKSTAVCPGKYSTRTQVALCRFQKINSWWCVMPKNHPMCSFHLSPWRQEVRAFFQEKARDLSRRVPLLLTTWLLCHVAKSTSSKEHNAIRSLWSHKFYFCDSGSNFAKYRTMSWAPRSLCSCRYTDVVHNQVRDELLPPSLLTKIFPRLSIDIEVLHFVSFLTTQFL